ncbi:death-associated protein kinase dapk-1-like isoform X1 [Montipora foliosa]|uniref:death-associated protein kinase dapk-1-like isoform X1 n=2 Tax=Montipora foliosa TaxID=591990 RepID=UPI0035F14237
MQTQTMDTDSKNLGEKLFYAGERGDLEMCRKFIEMGADVNWREGEKLWFRTVLMQAAKSGKTSVCRLYLGHGAEVDAFTQSNYTALTLAARYGHTETCKLLLSKGANVNNQTKDGETALMWAAGKGHTDTCKALLDAGADVNCQDTYGFTALSRAAQAGHLKPCLILLEAGADVSLVSTLGDKVWDAEKWAQMNKHQKIVKLIKSYKVLHSLLKDGSDPPSYVTLNVCGAVKAGKTTLIGKLQQSTFERVRNQDHVDTSDDIASRTAGIEIGIINVPGVGVFRKMDMAGHSWAFTSNEYFIGKRTSISLVLFDLSKEDKEVENDLFHHLGCLKARETKYGVLRYRPEVVLIATHADKMASDPMHRANAYFRRALECFQAYLNFYPRVMVLDCTNPSRKEFSALRTCLKELRDKIIKNSERVPRLCAQLLPRIRSLAKKKASFPVISWKAFVQETKQVNVTADEEGVRNVAFYLNEIAEIVSDNSPELRDKVVLDVNWLTSHIFGIALAPTNFPRSLRFDTASGMVSKADLEVSFPECPLEQLIELFVRFEVCIPWDEQKLLCDNYLFPSHLEQNRSNLDDVWPQFGESGGELCAVGRILECKNPIDMIPHSFFPKFQIRMLRRFGHRSPVWFGGIKIADDTVEILITLSSCLKAVNICVWAPKGNEERCYDTMKFIEDLRNELLDDVAGGVEFIHKAMSVKMLRQKRFEGYALNEVDKALEDKGPNARIVLENCAINESAVDVKCCGIRRHVSPLDHISHMTLRHRKVLAQLLDSDGTSNLTSLSENLGIGPFPMENDDMELSGFTNVISSSETDNFLSSCAAHTDLRGTELSEAFKRMNQVDAAAIVRRCLFSVDEDLAALSREEYQRSLSDQLVLQPRSRRLFDPCQGCQHCVSILPQQETRGPKSCNGEKESPASATDAVDDLVSVSVQVSSAANDESVSVQVSSADDDESRKDLSLSTAETGEPHEKASFPFKSELTELSSRLSLSWRPVARELGFGTTELCQFEETSLLRVQASRMLEDWLSKSRCRLGCKNCEESILEALAEAFENAHRADLKDFVEHSRKK